MASEDQQTRVARDAVRSLEAYAVYKAGNYTEARAIWEELARKGNTTALINLSNLFQLGQGVTEDQRRALEYTRRAAELGDPRAQFELGMAYETGHLLQRDILAASDWLKKAAVGGDVDGQFAWAVMLATAKGQGVDKSTAPQRREAVSWLRKARDQGHPEAGDYIKLLAVDQ